MTTRALERVLRLAGVTYQREQSVDSTSDRPADLLLRIGPKEDLCAVDVSVVHPAIPSAPFAEAALRAI